MLIMNPRLYDAAGTSERIRILQDMANYVEWNGNETQKSMWSMCVPADMTYYEIKNIAESDRLYRSVCIAFSTLLKFANQ